MHRVISFCLIILFHLQIFISVGYAHPISTITAVSSSSRTEIIQNVEQHVFIPKPSRTTVVHKMKRTTFFQKIKREKDTQIAPSLPRSDPDYAVLFEQLPIQLTLINTLHSDQFLLNHKKSMLYRAFQKLPKEHQQALKVLILKEEIGETRGLGGQNMIVLTMGNLTDEELIGVWMHEIGHVVDTGLLKGQATSASTFLDGHKPVLQDDPSTVFYQYSWKSSKEKKENMTAVDFVTGYAMIDPFEDFAESYTYYALHGNTFRSMLASSTILTQKYSFLKEKIFNGQEFKTGNSLNDMFKRTFDATLIAFDLQQFLET